MDTIIKISLVALMLIVVWKLVWSTDTKAVCREMPTVDVRDTDSATTYHEHIDVIRLFQPRWYI